MAEALRKGGLDRELKVVYGAAFKGFVNALRGPFVIDNAMDERLREMFADEGFQAILAELPRARFEEVDTTRARELFAGLGPPGATADDFDSAWHSLGRVFDERIAQTTHAARLAEKYRQDRIESSVAEIAAIMRPQDKSAALAAYRRDVYNLYRLAPVRDLFWRDQESTGNEIRLADVFVEPLLQRQDLRHEVKTIEDDGRPGTEDGRELLSALKGFREDPRTLADVLAMERRLVILGPPGSGKSTLATCLALALVTDEVTLDMGLPAETVPILVPLKTYAASLKERSNLRLDAFLEEQLGRQLPDLGAILSDGRPLVLFDGLDEVFDEAHRRWVSAEVSRLISLYLQARFLLTSRPYGYQAAPLTGAVPLFEIVAFDDDRIRRFFRRWFAALAREGHEGTPELRADALADEVLGRPRIRSLAENPMLCTLIVLIHHSGSGRLPERRVKFYEEAVGVLTERWERAKRSPKQEVPFDFPAPELMAGVLAEVAWKAQTELGGREIPADDLESWIEAALADDPEWGGKRKNAARDLLHVIRERTGLLADAGGDSFQFVHLSLQEYMVAFYLLDRLDDAQCCRVVRHFLHAPEWEEILRLTIGAASRNRADALVRAILDKPTSEWEEISRRDLRFVCRCMEDRPNVSEAVLGNVRSRWLKILEERSYDDEAALIRDGVGLGLTPETRKSIEIRLDSDDARVRRIAVEYFAKYHGSHESIHTVFEDKLKEHRSCVRRTAVEYFAEIGSDEDKYLIAIEGLLDDKDPRVREAAIEYFARVCAKTSKAREIFGRRIRSAEVDVLESAIHYFTRTSEDDRRIRKIVEAQLHESGLRAAVIKYLAKIGTRDRETRTTIREFLADEDDLVVLATIEYFKHIRAADEATSYAIKALLVVDLFLVPLGAIDYCIMVGVELSRSEIVKLLAHKNAIVRLAAIRYIAGTGAYDERTRAIIDKHLTDDDPAVRAAAVEFFSEVGFGPRLPPVLAALGTGASMFVSRKAKLKVSIEIGRQGAYDTALLDLIPKKWLPDYISYVFAAAAARRDEVRRQSTPLAAILESALPQQRPAAKFAANLTESLRMARLIVDDLRVFDHVSLDLGSGEADAGQWTLLLGDNAVGKTTLLRAIALACIEQPTSSALLELTGIAAPFVRHQETRAAVTLWTSAGEIRCSIAANTTSERLERQGPILPGTVFAYGCQRGTAFGGPMREVDLSPIGSVRTLFDDNAHLIHAETWLQEMRLAMHEGGGAREAFYEALRATLLAVLPGVESIDFDENAQLWLDGPKIGRSPLAAMSGGYVTTIGWIVDMVARWADLSHRHGVELDGDFRDKMTGLVLIDEIDLHLHPVWQTEIVSSLRRQFPRMSFVATTHNPLTLMGAKPGEIWVLRRDAESGHVDVSQRDIREGMSADDVLTGEWFGLVSTLDTGTQDLLDQHRALLRAGVAVDDPRRQELEKKLRRRLGTFPSTSLDRMVQSIAAELMEGDFRRKTPDERHPIRRQILERARKEKAELRA